MLAMAWLATLAAAPRCSACAEWRPARAGARTPAACAQPDACARVLEALRARSALRAAGRFEDADAIRAELLSREVELEDTRDADATLWRRMQPAHAPPGYPSEPRKSVREVIELGLRAADEGGEAARDALAATSVAQLAQAAAAVVADAPSFLPQPSDARACADACAVAALTRMRSPTGAPEMHGRKAADAAFNFALAGIADGAVFGCLADLLQNELRRLGQGQPTAILLALAEKLAAAGVDGSHGVFGTIAAMLERAQPSSQGGAAAAEPSTSGSRSGGAGGGTAAVLRGWRAGGPPLELFDSRPLLWLGRHARRQRKRTRADPPLLPAGALLPAQLAAAPSAICIDLGCGFGILPLGLAAAAREEAEAPAGQRRRGSSPVALLLASEPLVVGCDLSAPAIAYAAAMAARLGLSARLAFATASAAESLEWAARSCGEAGALGVLINFPTPYRQRADGGEGEDGGESEGEGADEPVEEAAERTEAYRGNAQLPMRDGFMANERLVCAAVEAVAARPCAEGRHVPSFLYLSTNVEDVAVHMRAHVERAAAGRLRALTQAELDGLEEMGAPGESAGSAEGEASAESATAGLLLPISTLRQAKYAQRGGPRAAGAGWLTSSPFPRRARTETEALCEAEGKPVFRCLFVPSV